MTSHAPATGAAVSLADVRIVASTALCAEHVAIELVVPEFPPSLPGQFIQILCRAAQETRVAAHEWPRDDFPSVSRENFADDVAYLRRPFSLADRWTGHDGSVHLHVISRAVGPGTRWLAQRNAGDTLSVAGPLGRGFRVPADERPLILVGGGVGIPPLLYLARRLHELRRSDVTAVFGATTRDLLPLRLTAPPTTCASPVPCVAFPADARFPVMITTDDGSLGLQGTVVDGLKTWFDQRGGPHERVAVYACGPEAMLRAVARVTRERRADCQLCIERPMGCGLGTCLSCVVRIRSAAQPEGWRWALACQDGPVFDRDELLDYQDPQRA